jgi:hypothetical protein
MSTQTLDRPTGVWGTGAPSGARTAEVAGRVKASASGHPRHREPGRASTPLDVLLGSVWLALIIPAVLVGVSLLVVSFGRLALSVCVVLGCVALLGRWVVGRSVP